MTTIKPICVIKCDHRNDILVPIYKIQSIMDERLGKDYHVLCVPFNQPKDESYEPIQLQVFYEKDFTPIQYAELKKIIEDAIESQKQKPLQ